MAHEEEEHYLFDTFTKQFRSPSSVVNFVQVTNSKSLTKFTTEEGLQGVIETV